ncbi:hypothetical protein [Paenibacillus mesophilus]|uniref:hypothetical protein n=1 Tax=Paenibacillus mesophilus TaxID=2582849 RepID=UPI003B75BFA4
MHYLIEIAHLLSPGLREEAARKTALLLEDPRLGADWGSGVQASISIRWNVELTAAYLLGLLGQETDAGRIVDAYGNDEHVYVRNMARIIGERLANNRISTTSGKVSQA